MMESDREYTADEVAGLIGLKGTRTKELLRELVAMDRIEGIGQTRGAVMDVVSVRSVGNQQTIDIPEDYHLIENKLYINRIGKALILIPTSDPWATIFSGLDMFTDDFMEDGRGELEFEMRESL